MPHRHLTAAGGGPEEGEEAKPSMDDGQGGNATSMYISAVDLGREEGSWSGGSGGGVVVGFEGDWGSFCCFCFDVVVVVVAVVVVEAGAAVAFRFTNIEDRLLVPDAFAVVAVGAEAGIVPASPSEWRGVGLNEPHMSHAKCKGAL